MRGWTSSRDSAPSSTRARSSHGGCWTWPAVQQELLIDLADAALQRGLAPGADEILDFTQSPVLGGPIDPGNLQVMDFAAR